MSFGQVKKEKTEICFGFSFFWGVGVAGQRERALIAERRGDVLLRFAFLNFGFNMRSAKHSFDS